MKNFGIQKVRNQLGFTYAVVLLENGEMTRDITNIKGYRNANDLDEICSKAFAMGQKEVERLKAESVDNDYIEWFENQAYTDAWEVRDLNYDIVKFESERL